MRDKKCNWCKKELKIEEQHCFEGALTKNEWVNYCLCAECSKKLRKIYLKAKKLKNPHKGV